MICMIRLLLISQASAGVAVAPFHTSFGTYRPHHGGELSVSRLSKLSRLPSQWANFHSAHKGRTRGPLRAGAIT
jgi:hypothetical protein